MTHLLLVGCWEESPGLLGALVQAEFAVTWLPPADTAPAVGNLALVRLHPTLALPTWLTEMPWLGWNVTDNPEAAIAAYRAKARLVLPASTTASLLCQCISQLAPSVPRETPPQPSASPRLITYQRGDSIRLPTAGVLEIQAGLVAQMVIHQDGAEVLLGFAGPGQLVIPHPEDSCFLQLLAHTDVTIQVQPWASASQAANFAERLRVRLWQLEAWAAMQARPHLEERLMGILALLAEQFGRPQPDGLLIDVRITHQQLAAAIGANRTTVTRLLSELRRRGLLTTLGYGQEERFCLLTWERSAHHHFVPVANPT
jgi:hypothetical protein